MSVVCMWDECVCVLLALCSETGARDRIDGIYKEKLAPCSRAAWQCWFKYFEIDSAFIIFMSDGGRAVRVECVDVCVCIGPCVIAVSVF